MKKWEHRLTNINLNNKTALCKKCGLVKLIRKKQRNKIWWRCVNALSIYRMKKRYNFDLKINFVDKLKTFSICPICLKRKKLLIDHCHKKNKFRGFICHHCNSLLGFSGDNINTLKNACKYLKNNM